MSSFTIFVLCHNRPDFTRQTLRSILDQTDKDFELVVSDNSSNDEVEQQQITHIADCGVGRAYKKEAPEFSMDVDFI